MIKPKPEKIYFINSKEVLGRAIRVISKLEIRSKNSYAVKVYLDTETRSIKQNKLAFFWYKIRAGLNGNTIDYDRRFCKLRYGVSLLLASDKYPEFHKFWHNALLILPYEEQIDAMAFVPVTRIMSTKHFAEYLNTIDKESALQGMALPQPEDLYMEALMLQENYR